MVAKSMGEKLQMQMDEGGSSLQRWTLPNAEVGVSQEFAMKFERNHRIPRDGD